MRTNRIGNLKRFFCIKDNETVLELDNKASISYDALNIDAASYDYIFWNPAEMSETKDDGADSISAKQLFTMLSETGKLVIYFDNPAGVHAFAQGKVCESSKLGYAFLQNELSEMNAHVRWFYPYPSVEFPSMFFSDERLPGKNECEDNFYHFAQARMEAFEEQEVTNRLVEAGMYPYLAQAYMVIVSKTATEEELIYTRFSNERREDAQIRTDLYRDRVKKSAVLPQAKKHVLQMQKTETALRELLKDMTILGKHCDVNAMIRADEEKGAVDFEYISGRSLEQILDEWLGQGKTEDVTDVLLGFCKALYEHKALTPFVMTDEFKRVFAQSQPVMEYAQKCTWKSLPVSDIDLVCQNILLDEKATVIDFEWTYTFPVPVEFLAFRFLYFYLEAKNRTCMQQNMLSDLYEKAGITDEMRKIFLQMETSFQHYVQQGAQVLCNSFDESGKAVLTKQALDRQLEKLDGMTATVKANGQEYEIGGKYSKDGMYIYRIPDDAKKATLSLLGFDARQKARVLRIGAMAETDGKHTGLSPKTNGMHLGGLLYLYENCVPQVTIEEACVNAEISVEEIAMSQAAIRELKTEITDMRFIIQNREQQISDLKSSASWKVTRPLRMLKGNKEE